FTTSRWSGGTTTELFIYPESASYAKRNFLFRLSTATVETETSLFTSLPYVSRTLMVLDGKTELTHKDEYVKMLYPFESDTFRGEWRTTSNGKCVDFNLMCCEGAQGLVRHQKLEKGVQQIELKGKMNFIFLFKGI